jgi:hypothetical protein
MAMYEVFFSDETHFKIVLGEGVEVVNNEDDMGL